MRYIISGENPHRHFLQIEFVVSNISGESLELQLPAWRPGRYVLQNFSKNIRAFAVYDEKGKSLSFEKITKDKWKVEIKNAKQVHVKYEYYANVLDAGSTYLDDKQLYVNPVNCLLYVPGRENEKCEVQLNIQKKYMVTF